MDESEGPGGTKPESVPALSDPRTVFAAERTLLAWVRTGLALMGFGFVVARFGLFLRELGATRAAGPGHSTGISFSVGIALVLLGVVVTAMSAFQYRRIINGLVRGEPYVPPRVSLATTVSVALTLLGIAVVIYLLVLGS